MTRLIAAALTLLLVNWWLLGGVFGHDDLDWVAQQGLRNKAGEWCCGKGDCEYLSKDDVKAVNGGYRILSLNEFVPQIQALPFSPGGFIRCHRPDKTLRCLIVEPSGF